jgi:hypothetical protein
MSHIDFPQFGRFEAWEYRDQRVAMVAREIRGLCGQGKNGLFDPFRAAETFGFEVRIEAMRGEEGRLWMDLPVPRIEISDAVTPLRQRFTLCHELAHLCFAERSPWILSLDSPDAHAKVDEREEKLCDAIAAELLMPRTAFKKKARDMTPSIQAVSELSRHYNVSVAAVITQIEKTRSWSVGRASWEIQAGVVSPPRLKRVVMRSKLRKALAIRTRDGMIRVFEIAGRLLARDRNGSRELSTRLDAGRYVTLETLEGAVMAVRLAANPYVVGGTVFY